MEGNAASRPRWDGDYRSAPSALSARNRTSPSSEPTRRKPAFSSTRAEAGLEGSMSAQTVWTPGAARANAVRAVSYTH
ncbi:hypothetical protein, partial [Streptomyces resistomycificus]